LPPIIAGTNAFSNALRPLSQPPFAWTLKSQEELDKAKAEGFDGFIFDSFEAKL